MKKHDHIHLVVPIRGSGSCLVDDKVFNLEINNVIHVPSWSWHQFRASNEETLGFLCLVTCDRDRPTLPTKEDIEALKKNPAVAEFIRAVW
jgi:gentisate 1,2-dioxygenase